MGINKKLVGLIGWPVEHSVSPAMFNASFQALGMSWQYEAFAVEPRNLERTVTALHNRGIEGFNVTVPHKQAIMELLDIVQPAGRVIGAVNTVSLNRENDVGLWQGTNTDALGFRTDLTACIGEPAPQSNALILGAGGAARAAAYVLADLGYQIHILSRNPARGLELIRDVQSGLTLTAHNNNDRNDKIGSTVWRMSMRILPWDRLQHVKVDIHLIVNCTPVGMWPHIDESPWPDEIPIPATAAVYDMIYRPQETKLMQQAKKSGAQAFNGLGMLVQQGAAAFTLWTGRDAPLDMMRTAAQKALNT